MNSENNTAVADRPVELAGTELEIKNHVSAILQEIEVQNGILKAVENEIRRLSDELRNIQETCPHTSQKDHWGVDVAEMKVTKCCLACGVRVY